MCCALDTCSKDLIWGLAGVRTPRHPQALPARIRRCNPTGTVNRGAAIRAVVQVDGCVRDEAGHGCTVAPPATAL